MNSLAFRSWVIAVRTFPRLQFPLACLIALLQRTPAVRAVAATLEFVSESSAGAVLKSGLTIAASLGAVDTLAGATALTATSASPLKVTVGTAITSVAMSVTGAQSNCQSYTISNSMPPGLTMATSGGSVTSSTSLPATINGSTLTLSGTPTTAGTYNIYVRGFANTNGGGHASSTFTYQVVVSASSSSVAAPTITTQPASLVVTAGASATFSVTASSTATLTYQWYKDGSAISGATSSSYTISSTTTSSAGSYTVVVTNSGGSTTSSAATLTVNAAATAPSVSTQPSSQSVTTGSSATFSVTATGSATLTYQWYKDGSAISGATSSSYTISSVTSSNAGSYTVVVSNSVGNVTSSAATLTVTTAVAAPTITANPSSQAVTVGHTASFTASSSIGSGTWQVSTNSGSSWSSTSDGSTYTGSSSTTLTVASVTSAMNGYLYRYVSTNSGGSATSTSAVLTVVSALLPYPTGLALSSSGSFIVVDATANTVATLTTAGVVTTLAGTSGSAGSTDATGSSALFNTPNGIALDSSGNVFVADTANATIRKITSAGVVTTFAGSTSTRGNTDATGTAATFSYPMGVAIDSSANLYVADATNHTIRKITSAGVVTTFAGGAGVSGSNDGSGTSARFNYPCGVAVDSAGNVYVADTTNNTIRKITAAGVVTTLAGTSGVSGASDGAGTAALFNQPTGLALDSSGNLYVADTGNSAIRRISTAGEVTTFAGLPTIAGLLDGTGTAAWFNQPKALALDSSGNLWVADTGNAAIRKVTSAGVVTTLTLSAGSTSSSSSTSTSTGTSTTTTTTTSSSSSSGGGGGGAPSEWFLGAVAALAYVRWRRRAVGAQ